MWCNLRSHALQLSAPALCPEVSSPAAVVATEQLECLVPQQLQLTLWYINLSHSRVQFVLMSLMICELCQQQSGHTAAAAAAAGEGAAPSSAEGGQVGEESET